MTPEDPTSESNLLDEEIASLKAQAAALRKSLKIESSTILSADSTHAILQPSAITHNLRRPNPARNKLLTEAVRQRAYIQQSLHRICSSVTSFKVLDPDPNAVDGGHVLGLRFEVMSRGQFLRPYYVMLNRPYSGSKHLRVHRHTLPPAIPLAGLAARHLPARNTDRDDSPQQDLDRFVRTLRREIARYHNRLGVSADLRRGLGLHEQTTDNLKPNDIVDVGIADIEAKQIRFTWADERSGRIVMDDDGKVLKLMIFGKQGRDWETTKELYGNFDRIEDVAKRLQEYAQA
ncbi:Cenp-O kinetochore centromere component-domain-containing protein [Dactylonectria estremocensis]|uniref:Cenp-O kinetochore centromere component-domain-containing protein n=1 Tax=Dactylonectria estremocensis TaxID=1079267 RepID=A0A9P9F9Z8_9HYPO|nr:Cenp-O kinetochore centromere component-domain-containing protein [Dactylonectria estremocensis]